MIPLEHDILSDFFLVPDSLVSSCYLGISASLEAERHHRRPQRLLLAWGKTTAAQHVVVWHLDHTFEKLASAHLPLVAAAPLVDALRASPAKPLALFDLARRLPLRLHRRGALYFLHLSPRMFGLRAPLPLSLSLTAPATELLAVAASPTAAAVGSGNRWGDGDGEGCTSGAI
ncbi:Os04g0618900 [Oryza sativa Japonica Group]|uniref:Os04g0618900 protein n=1 Tax=Oryza sativa subsp. japonica TaxID=39947 RepID=A0A0P0WES9_ORYSJ|nr:Os04g0618900 [Oryza sativa Japonica Group]